MPPVLELQPNTAGVSVHTHTKVTLRCVGSGFPRPELEWSPSEGFKQRRAYVDHYTAAAELVAESALPAMTGMYKCRLCNRSSEDGTSEEENVPVLHTYLLVYGRELVH